MTTSVRTPRSDAKPEPRVRPSATEFEVQWRDPERTFVDYVAAIWSRKIWIGLATLVATLSAVIFALTQPNVYASHASLLVVGNRSGSSAAEVAANMLRMGNIGPSQVLSALEVVNSTVVAERVVEKLGAAEITRPYQPERGSEEERRKMGVVDSLTDWMHRQQASWFRSAQTESSLKPEVAAEVFRRNFSAWADERAMLIKMVYRAGSRTRAQRVLQEVVQVSIERYREVCAPEKSRDWVLGRVETAEKAYEDAKEQYEQFLLAHGRVRFAEEITAQERAKASAESALQAAKRTHDLTKQNLETWREKIGRHEPRRRRDLDVMEDNSAARNELIQEQVRLQNEKIKFEFGAGTTQGQMTIITKQLANVTERLESLDKPRTLTFIDDNPEYLQIDARIRELALREAELELEIPRLESEVEHQGKELRELYAAQEEADRLVEMFTRAKTEVERLRQARDTWEFDAQLNTLGLSSLQPVEQPTVPLLKEGPQRTRIIVAGGAVGLLAALTLIMLLVRMSKTFLRTSEVAVCLGRGDVVGMPLLERGNVRRFRLARKRGWD